MNLEVGLKMENLLLNLGLKVRNKLIEYKSKIAVACITLSNH